MRRRINLLALLVIAAGGAVIAGPTPASATYINPLGGMQSCCTAYDGYGRIVQRCCSNNGCVITYGRCLPLA